MDVLPTAAARPASTGPGDVANAKTQLRTPTLSDAAGVWQLIANTAELDLNSSYSYLLWCRDFAATSIVAIDDARDGRLAGVITGYLRPAAPDTLFVWQVAVDPAYRGQRIGSRMLTGLLEQLRDKQVRWVETTVTADNDASNRLFASFARTTGVDEQLQPLFTEEMYPDSHETELLHRIGPFPI